MHSQRKHAFIGAYFLLISIHTMAQNATSPYSIIGVGDIEKSSFDRTSGMGYAGASLSSNRYLYHANPASYSALDDKFFTIEISSRFKHVNYEGKSISSDFASIGSSDLQMKKIAIALKIKPSWAISMGILPYSTTNYSFIGTKNIQGSDLVLPASYEGSGGINQFYFANSFKVNKSLRWGIQMNYLFGQFLQEETLSSGLTNADLTTSKNVFIGKINFKSGIQYQKKLSNKWQLLLGSTAELKTNFNANTTTTVKDGTTILSETEKFDNNFFTIPATYKTSIGLKLKDTYTFVTDYSFQNWTAEKYKGLGYTLVNSNTLAFGVEYSKKLKFRNGSFERFFLQAGSFYNNSYVRMSNEQIKDIGFTIGGGIHSLKNNLGIQMNVELGRRGTTNKGLIRENYSQFNLTFSYRDFWFVKVKRYD